MKRLLGISLGALAIASGMAACNGSSDTGAAGGTANVGGSATGGAATSGGATSGGASVGGGATSGGAVSAGGTGGAVEMPPVCGDVALGGQGGEGGAPPLPEGCLFAGSGTWIDDTSNSVGIQGSFYVLEDSANGDPETTGLLYSDFDPDNGDKTTEPSTFEGASSPCISGTAEKVFDPVATNPVPYSAIWGGGIGLNLNYVEGEAGADGAAAAYDSVAKGVIGFEFVVTGDPGGADVRFKATQFGLTDDADFCLSIKTKIGQVNRVLFSDLKHQCWTGGMASKELDVTQLGDIQWQIVTDTTAAHVVKNFCVENLAPIMAP
jgi:hypothetical protein